MDLHHSHPDTLPPKAPSAHAAPRGLPTHPKRPLPALAVLLLLFLGVLGSLGAYRKWQARHFPLPSWHGPVEAVSAPTAPLVVPPPAPAEVDGERVLSDTGGAIAEITLHYSPEDEPMLGPFYRDLFDKLDRDVRINVFCPSEEAVHGFEVRWGSVAGVANRKTALFNLGRTLSLWPRDRRIARQSPDGLPARSFVPSPIAGYEEDKRNDLLITSILWPSGHLPGSLLVSFQLEGGNLVANNHHLFTGINVLGENTERFADATGLARALEQVFGLPAILLGDRNDSVPWDHADMYVTPIHQRLMLVADLREGLRLYQGHDLPPPIGDSSSSDSDLPWDLKQVTPEPERIASLEDIASQLSSLGYEVRRLPALMHDQKEWMLTYNNVLMEHRHGRDIVYLPLYHHPRLDAAAIALYQALGFEVRTLDVSRVYHMGGAVRCLASVTRRLPRA